MDNPTRSFWTNFRAALLKEAHDLQELRAAKLQQAADIQHLLEDVKDVPCEVLREAKLSN
jgi:hypothetical protein